MKIAFTGTHSTGKTTLLEALRTEPSLSHFYFDANVTRWVKSLGFAINEHTSSESQEINMLKRVANLNTYDNLIADRSIADVLAYSINSDMVTKESLKYQQDLVDNNIHKYDILFYIPPVFPGVDDGERAVGEEYRAKIDASIIRIVNPRPLNVYVLDQLSIRERLQKIMDVINEARTSENTPTGNK